MNSKCSSSDLVEAFTLGYISFSSGRVNHFSFVVDQIRTS